MKLQAADRNCADATSEWYTRLAKPMAVSDKDKLNMNRYDIVLSFAIFHMMKARDEFKEMFEISSIIDKISAPIGMNVCRLSVSWF